MIAYENKGPVATMGFEHSDAGAELPQCCRRPAKVAVNIRPAIHLARDGVKATNDVAYRCFCPSTLQRQPLFCRLTLSPRCLPQSGCRWSPPPVLACGCKGLMRPSGSPRTGK